MNNKSWERLDEIIKWSGLSTHAFAMKIGMKRSENLYRIMRNKENVSAKLAMLIVDHYPQINRNWLLYEEGEMFNVEADFNIDAYKIPFYSTAMEGSLSDTSDQTPSFNMYIPLFREADKAITVIDKAMEPTIPMGSIIILKKQTTDFILYGQTYLIETQEASMIRVIRKSEADYNGEIVLEAANTERFDSITINKSKILSLYNIYGVITKF